MWGWRHFLFSVLLISISTMVKSQTVHWDSTSRPDISAYLVETFKMQKVQKGEVVFLGNSITYWGQWSSYFSTKKIKNRGIPGDITFGVLARLDEVIEAKPSKVFIMIGVNDLARGIPDTVIIENYRRIINRIKKGSPFTSIYFQTMLPTNYHFNKLNSHYHKEKSIQLINGALAGMSKAMKVTLVNLYPEFSDSENQLKKEYTWDGVHLTMLGYKKWVEILIKEKYLN